MPKELLRAVSGFRFGLPTLRCWICTDTPCGLLTAWLVTVVAAYSSLKLGARTSFELTARRRRPSIGVVQVVPSFQALALPAVLYFSWRSATFRLASPQRSDFRKGRLNST